MNTVKIVDDEAKEALGKRDFVKESRVPVLAVSFVMGITGFVTWQSVRWAVAYAQRMSFVWQGRDADIMFLVARDTIWQSVLIGGGLLAAWRMARAKSSVAQLAAAAGAVKIAVAALLSVKFSGTLGLWLAGRSGMCVEPLICLRGWRLFQIADLAALIGLLPAMTVLEDAVMGWSLSARTRRRAVLAAGCLAALYLASSLFDPAGRHAAWRGEDGRGGGGIEESEPDPHDGYRLEEDEPWSFRG